MGDDNLRQTLAGFDDYCQKIIAALDPLWDASTRVHNMEYCLFLYGAALAIARGSGRNDSYSAILWAPYLSQFMDLEDSIDWTTSCEIALGKSRRLQGMKAAGGNTAQAVLYAGSHGRTDDLNSPQNKQFLAQIFSELRKMMDNEAISDELLFESSGLLYDSVVKE